MGCTGSCRWEHASPPGQGKPRPEKTCPERNKRIVGEWFDQDRLPGSAWNWFPFRMFRGPLMFNLKHHLKGNSPGPQLSWGFRFMDSSKLSSPSALKPASGAERESRVRVDAFLLFGDVSAENRNTYPSCSTRLCQNPTENDWIKQFTAAKPKNKNCTDANQCQKRQACT